MKNALRVTTLWATALLVPVALSAADETVSGTLTVQQDLLVHQTVEVGQTTLGSVEYPAYVLQGNSALGITSIDQIAYGTVSSWNWSANDGSGSRKVMLLGNDGKLSLYSPTDATAPVIVINAGGTAPDITISGNKVVTVANIGLILTADNGYTALGMGAKALGSYSAALGSYSTASGSSATAVGTGATTKGNFSIALGNYASVKNDYAIALGPDSLAEGEGSMAIGPGMTYVSGDYALALGAGANALGEYTMALGASAQAIAIYSSALGRYANSGGISSLAIGLSASAEGDHSIALGRFAQATGFSSTSLGNYTQASGFSGVAVGGGANAIADNSVAVGTWALANQDYQVALGSFNAPLENAHFMIGNGGPDTHNRSNLFVIMKDGRGVFRSTSFVDPETPTVPQTKEALTVEGAATIKGTLRVRPAGDLPMGIFTAGGEP